MIKMKTIARKPYEDSIIYQNLNPVIQKYRRVLLTRSSLILSPLHAVQEPLFRDRVKANKRIVTTTDTV